MSTEWLPSTHCRPFCKTTDTAPKTFKATELKDRHLQQQGWYLWQFTGVSAAFKSLGQKVRFIRQSQHAVFKHDHFCLFRCLGPMMKNMACMKPYGSQTNKCKLKGKTLELFLKLVILSQCLWGQARADNPLETATPSLGVNANWNLVQRPHLKKLSYN